LVGKKTVPERIRETRPTYYARLKSADIAFEQGRPIDAGVTMI